MVVSSNGVPADMKRKMEEKALETMGENKASYMMKDTLKNIPTSDQKVETDTTRRVQDSRELIQEQEINELRDGISNTAGGALQNPIGKLAGNTADDASRPVTGR